MFKILYILFFIGVIMFLQYVLRKPETFDNHLDNDTDNDPDYDDEINLTQRQSNSDDTAVEDLCLNFNHLLQNYELCCSGTNSSKGCRKPLCETAYPIFNKQVDEYNQKVVDYNQLQSQYDTLETTNNLLQNDKNQLQSQYDTLETKLGDGTAGRTMGV